MQVGTLTAELRTGSFDPAPQLGTSVLGQVHTYQTLKTKMQLKVFLNPAVSHSGFRVFLAC